MLNQNMNFLTSEQGGSYHDHIDVSYCRVEFQLSSYTDKLFQSLNVDFPSVLNDAVNKRKAEFLAGRYCAKRALLALNVENPKVGIGYKRAPIWPNNIKGAISHTTHTAICITTADEKIKGIGVDQEIILEDKIITDIQSQIVSQQEVKLLRSIELSFAAAFTMAFSIKESFFKAMFPKYLEYFDFDAVSIIESDVNRNMGRVTISLNMTFSSDFKKGQKLQGLFTMYKEEHGPMVETFIVLR